MVETTLFHDYEHAVEFDRRAQMSDIRAELAERLIEAMQLAGDEVLLDIATGTGRFARPVARHLPKGTILGIDESLAMFRVAQENTTREPIPSYARIAATAELIPLADGTVDKAWVAFSLHHFSSPPKMAREAARVLRARGGLFILDPVVLPSDDATDKALSELINEVFRRSHGNRFRFYSIDEIGDLLTHAGLEVRSAERYAFAVDQEGTEGIPTGRHWIEVVDELERRPGELRERFKQRYFDYTREGDRFHIRGKFNYGLVCGERQD